MKKRLAFLVLIILSAGMVMVGCKSESPTDVVNTYFEQIKKGDSEEAGNLIESTISQAEEGTDDKSDESSNKAVEESLELYISKIDAKVLSEKIDGDNATVEVELIGPNYSNLLLEVIEESIADAFSGTNIDDEYMGQKLLEKVKSSKSETRTGEVNLIKEDKEWKIKSDDDVLNLFLGKATEQSDTNSK